MENNISKSIEVCYIFHSLGIAFGIAISFLIGSFKYEWQILSCISSFASGLLAFNIWAIPDQEKDELNINDNILKTKFIREIIFSIIAMFLLHFTGIWTIMPNLQSYLQAFTDVKSITSFGPDVIGFVPIFLSVPLYFFIKKLGPKNSLISACFGQCICLLITSFQKFFTWSSTVSLTFLTLDYAMYLFVMVPITWKYVLDLFPDSVKEQATLLNNTFGWIFMFIALMIWPPINNNMKWGLFVFACECLVAALLGIFAPTPAKNEVDGELKSHPLLLQA